jgi:tyrosinase
MSVRMASIQPATMLGEKYHGSGSTASIRTRRDVWKIPANDTTLEWYAKAVAALWDKPFDDPLSWRYQGAIHDYNPADDPLKKPGDQPPADDDRFRRLCQHGSTYFLPWHRVYLFYFEQLIATTVVQLGGPVGWSLPYWNYSDQNNPNARQLPPTFRDRNSRLFVHSGTRRSTLDNRWQRPGCA